MISETTRLCRVCRRMLPDPPAAPACAHCGTLHLPHHSTWPPVLKWYLIRELALAYFLEWKSTQEVFEDLLRDTRNGIRVGSARPNPHGHTIHTPAIELYAEVVKAAEAWKEGGCRIQR